MFYYRPIKAQDRDAYCQMAHAFYYSDAVLHPIPDVFIEATFDELMRGDTYASAYIFVSEDQTIGYALLAKTFSQEAGGMVLWVEELYIKDAFRSKGFGSCFLRELTENPPEGVKRIRLEVERKNERAVAFYESLGFSFLDYDQMLIERCIAEKAAEFEKTSCIFE